MGRAGRTDNKHTCVMHRAEWGNRETHIPVAGLATRCEHRALTNAGLIAVDRDATYFVRTPKLHGDLVLALDAGDGAPTASNDGTALRKARQGRSQRDTCREVTTWLCEVRRGVQSEWTARSSAQQPLTCSVDSNSFSIACRS